MKLIKKLKRLFKLAAFNNNKKDMPVILNELEILLRRYDFTLEANTVAGVIPLLALDQNKACQLMVAQSWWIGKDAVAEADLGIAGGFTSRARLDLDLFQGLIIELYQRLQEQGYDSEYARLVTSQFNKWLVSRI